MKITSEQVVDSIIPTFYPSAVDEIAKNVERELSRHLLTILEKGEMYAVRMTSAKWEEDYLTQTQKCVQHIYYKQIIPCRYCK